MLGTPPATAGFRTTDPESFWIDTGLSGTSKKCETFVPENNNKRLGAAQTCPGLPRPSKRT